MYRTIAAALFGLALAQAGLSAPAVAAQGTGKPSKTAAKPADEAHAGEPKLISSAFAIAHQLTGEIIAEHKGEEVLPIASITKLMTAMVVLDSGQGLSDALTISRADFDTLKGTGSRLPLGTRLSREQMLLLALMSSENRAASALARHYPGGEDAFVKAMNVKARMIGLNDTRFFDGTGLDPRNVSSPRDLVRMVAAAAEYPLIREFTTADERQVRVGRRLLQYRNSNSLVRKPGWDIGLSKTGFIREAGRCVVMQTWLQGEPVIIVLMNARSRWARDTDANRLREWLQSVGLHRLAHAGSQHEG
ncbi:serine hydrolase [Pseudothauera rhizosphaerae]|uniref:Peptidase S11 n=1 Tax=Pseudothauera rhizosphaerae TaxID=2565932 RepID=A0A4S4AF39_9RHOO|nr:serine hydrolase [Pseudothauera rhizosphaerae]THF57693.1 peptidase S11 [Pseudothauera rhizosphaerae]